MRQVPEISTAPSQHEPVRGVQAGIVVPEPQFTQLASPEVALWPSLQTTQPVAPESAFGADPSGQEAQLPKPVVELE